MTTMAIELDDRTVEGLNRISAQAGDDPARIAARMLSRAVRLARQHPVYDANALRVATREFAADEGALAESDLPHRADLLRAEDAHGEA